MMRKRRARQFDLIGRTIVAYSPRRRREPDGIVYFDPLFTLDNGTAIEVADHSGLAGPPSLCDAFTTAQVWEAAKLIAGARHELGSLSDGELRDLLLDNFNWLQSWEHAKALLTVIQRGKVSA